MEAIYQITMNVLLYLYAISDTTTSNSLKAIFNREDVTVEEGVSSNKTWSQLSFGNISFTVSVYMCNEVSTINMFEQTSLLIFFVSSGE